MGISIVKPAGVPGRSWPAIVIGCFVAFGGLLFGYDTGTIGGILAMDYWRKEFSTGYVNPNDKILDVSPSQSAAVVSILSAGTFFGALTAAPLADLFGRRLALLLSAGIVFNFGVVLQTASTALPMFIAGRFFAGFGVGLISALIPLYQSETAPKWIRGVIVGCYQLAITIGLLLAAVVDNATQHRNDTGSYRIPIAVQFLWAIILVIGLLFLPETPRYLIKLGKSSSYLDCFRGGMAKRLATGCLLQALQQLTGVNFIFYYGTQYFKNSGISNAFVIQMITSAVNVSSTLPGLYGIEKFGRRPLLLWGAVGMCISQLLVAVLGTVTTGQNPDGSVFAKNLAGQKASIAFICIYIFFFASTWGPLAWVVCGEIFPLKVRAKALSMSVATNWLLNWAIAYSTPYLVNYGEGNANLQSKIFFIWFACCFVCIAFVYFMIYETKGLTLEQIDELYESNTSAKNSVHWKPSKHFVDLVDGHENGGVLVDEKTDEKTSASHSAHSPARHAESGHDNAVASGRE
ncbi:hexose transporter protein [Botrytis cinerea]